ncbi:hypothetical protein UG55_105744 [Frankia sp. EI5c]|uniref:hypothetical protein n=1 Tax=Frankia sp. EI5c TaxID=683316 RepID=UPI0007C3C43B|nr:hypothetical protein [Frankia sp. EI5c]OAA21625.1 hypothetical protein UG55_105744 [Frankia sp. EI5c]
MSDLSSSECTPGSDFGPLVLSDLANRAEKAHAEHVEGYTAGTVLHRLYLAEGFDDEEFRGALDLVLARLGLWRVRTRAEWRQAYNAWAIPAGADPVPADPTVVDGESFAHVDEFDDIPLDDNPYDPHA